MNAENTIRTSTRFRACVPALVAVAAFGACGVVSNDGGESVERWWVGPEVVDCEGVAPQTCLEVAESESGEYQLLYDPINGFEHQEGTSYVLDVRVIELHYDDDVQDAPPYRYELVDIIDES
ncbi:MAG: DUF4377 domain-containing protein [Actinomycetota bacterium]